MEKNQKIIGLLKIHGVKAGEKVDISELPEEKKLAELTTMLLLQLLVFKYFSKSIRNYIF